MYKCTDVSGIIKDKEVRYIEKVMVDVKCCMLNECDGSFSQQSHSNPV